MEVHGHTVFVPQLFQVAFDYSILKMVLMGRARRGARMNVRRWKSWIARLSRSDGLTVVFTTHQPDHTLTVADRVQLMLPGDAASGPVDQVLTEDALSALYGVRLQRVVVGIDGTSR